MSENKGPIFIVGCDRSGTTLLRLMLIQSPDLYIPAESKFLTILKDKSYRYGDFSLDFQRKEFINDLKTNHATDKTFTFPIFKLSEDEALSAILNISPTDFAGASSALFSASAKKQGKVRWGDKTPYHVLDIPWLAEAFPKAKFIHIIRDGRDVAISLLRVGWVHNIKEAAVFWKTRVVAGMAARQYLPKERYLEMRFEDLITNPEETLKSICHWLELGYSPKMLEFHLSSQKHIPQEHKNIFKLADKPLDSSRIYNWEKTFSNKQAMDFQAIAGDELRLLQYKVADSIPVLSVSNIVGVQPPLYFLLGRFAKKVLRVLLPKSAFQRLETIIAQAH